MQNIFWNALRGCRNVAEVGCGFGVVLKQLTEKGYRAHGVDIWQPYLDYVNVVAPRATWEQGDGLEWCEKQADQSWDGVLMIDFIEHVDREAGASCLEHALRIARRMVGIATPHGYVAQEPEETVHIGTKGVPDMFNPYQKHVCGWDRSDLEARGFRCIVKRGNLGYDRLYAAWTR